MIAECLSWNFDQSCWTEINKSHPACSRSCQRTANVNIYFTWWRVSLISPFSGKIASWCDGMPQTKSKLMPGIWRALLRISTSAQMFVYNFPRRRRHPREWRKSLFWEITRGHLTERSKRFCSAFTIKSGRRRQQQKKPKSWDKK